MEVHTRLVTGVAGIAVLYLWYVLGTAASLPQWSLLAIVAGGAFGSVLVVFEETDLDGSVEFVLSFVTGLVPSILFGSYSSETMVLFWLVAVLVLFATEARKAVEENVFGSWLS